MNPLKSMENQCVESNGATNDNDSDNCNNNRIDEQNHDCDDNDGNDGNDDNVKLFWFLLPRGESMVYIYIYIYDQIYCVK